MCRKSLAQFLVEARIAIEESWQKATGLVDSSATSGSAQNQEPLWCLENTASPAGRSTGPQSDYRSGKPTSFVSKQPGPDLVLMNISMPKLSGIEAAGSILSNNASARIIILSTHSNKRFVEAGPKAGVSGYVPKASIFDDLLPVVRAVMANALFLSPRITDVEIGDYTKQPPKADASVSGI